MTAATLQTFTEALVEREQRRGGGNRKRAWTRIAQRASLLPGTVENLLRGRLKRISADIRDRLVSALIADLSREIERLSHDRQVLLAMGAPPDCGDLAAAEIAIQSARAALAKMKR